jgi:hypothetical protein
MGQQRDRHSSKYVNRAGGTVGRHGSCGSGSTLVTAAWPLVDAQVRRKREEGKGGGGQRPRWPTRSKPPSGGAGRQAEEARWPSGQPDGTTAEARAHDPTPTCGRSTHAHRGGRSTC